MYYRPLLSASSFLPFSLSLWVRHICDIWRSFFCMQLPPNRPGSFAWYDCRDQNANLNMTSQVTAPQLTCKLCPPSQSNNYPSLAAMKHHHGHHFRQVCLLLGICWRWSHLMLTSQLWLVSPMLLLNLKSSRKQVSTRFSKKSFAHPRNLQNTRSTICYCRIYIRDLKADLRSNKDLQLF